MTSMMVSNVVQLVNEGTTTFSMKYGPRDRLILQPGERLFVQEEVAWHFLGRWWTDNSNPRSRDRQEEVNRLHVLYGAYEDDVIWQANKPQIVAYTAEGQRVTSVIDDPDGMTSGPQTPFGMQQSEATQMAFMQEQINRLTSLLAGMKGIEAADLEPPEIDGSVTAPSTPPWSPVQPSGQVGGQTLPIAPDTLLPSAPGLGVPTAPSMVQNPEMLNNDAETSPRLEPQVAVAYTPPPPSETVVDDELPVDDPQKIQAGARVKGNR